MPKIEIADPFDSKVEIKWPKELTQIEFNEIIQAPNCRILGLTFRQIELLKNYYYANTGKRAETIGEE